MKTQHLIIGGAVLAGVGGYLYWRSKQTTKPPTLAEKLAGAAEKLKALGAYFGLDGSGSSAPPATSDTGVELAE